jgi:hypothetical protein
MDLKETGRNIVDWIHLAKVRDMWRDIVSTVMNLRVFKISRSFSSICLTRSFATRNLFRAVTLAVRQPKVAH